MASAPPVEADDEQYTTLENPVIPVVENLALRPGQSVVLRGSVRSREESGETRFGIDMCCGLLVNGDHRDNVALHVNPRFDLPGGWFSGEPDRSIVLNTLINNDWGKEERYPNILSIGEQFTLHIRAFENYFKIAINDRHLCDFAHRLPIATIRCILIQGCISIDSITIPK